MDYTGISQLGVAGITLIILWVVVRYFITAITRKDEQMTQIVKDFNTTISNYMAHETIAFNELSKGIKELFAQTTAMMKRIEKKRIKKK